MWQHFEFTYHACTQYIQKITWQILLFKRTIHNEIFSFLDCSEFHAQVPATNPRDRGGVTWSKWTEKSTDARLSRNTIHRRYRLPEYGCKYMYKCDCMGGSRVVMVVVRGGGSYARCNPHVEKFQKIIKQIRERHEKNINLIPNLFFFLHLLWYNLDPGLDRVLGREYVSNVVKISLPWIYLNVTVLLICMNGLPLL